jgi:cAMP-dependent protein kinase regulator
VFKEGDSSNNFYLIISGAAEAHKLVDGCKILYFFYLILEETCVKNYQEGDYFGELALLNNKPRAASIYAKVYII